MRPEIYATVTHGVISGKCHYCHASIEGPDVAALRLEDVQEYWDCDASEGTPQAGWYVCHTQHEALLLEDRHYASGRHNSAGAVQEAVAHDENSQDVYRISLNALCTVPDVTFHTHHTIRPHCWLADINWLTVVAAPVGLTHPDHAEPMASWPPPLHDPWTAHPAGPSHAMVPETPCLNRATRKRTSLAH
jgi:hypothetical protein